MLTISQRTLETSNIVLVLSAGSADDARTSARAALLKMLGYNLRVTFANRNPACKRMARLIKDPPTVLPELELDGRDPDNARLLEAMHDAPASMRFITWMRHLANWSPPAVAALARYVARALPAMETYLSHRKPELEELDATVIVLEHGPLLLALAAELLHPEHDAGGRVAISSAPISLPEGMALIRPGELWGGFIDLAHPPAAYLSPNLTDFKQPPQRPLKQLP